MRRGITISAAVVTFLVLWLLSLQWLAEDACLDRGGQILANNICSNGEDRPWQLAKIPGVIPHDLRRSTIRRWESMGVPRSAVMQATGHRPNTIHEQYAFLNEDELVQVFINAGLVATPKVVPIKKAGTR